MANKIELNPCPFCGEKQIVYPDISHVFGVAIIQCHHCNAKGPLIIGYEVHSAELVRKAAEAWNRRANNG